MRVLVTAGSTWARVDDIRILTNRFTGKTGLYLAQGLKKKGHSVTLLINPHCLGKIAGLRFIPYRYFEEFKREIIKAIKKQHYDVIIHSAAVSDYQLKYPRVGKIPSGKLVTLKLVPTDKIIKQIRALASDSLLIQFKLAPKQKGIIKEAYRSLRENQSDFVVANAFADMQTGYKAFLINRDKKVISLGSKRALLTALDRVINSGPVPN
ncbi:MAG: phosphopantothenoylcysteine decarboxylase [Candidatus Omnitrophota bacterium]